LRQPLPSGGPQSQRPARLTTRDRATYAFPNSKASARATSTRPSVMPRDLCTVSAKASRSGTYVRTTAIEPPPLSPP